MGLNIWAENALLTAGLFWILTMAWGAGHLILRLFALRDLRPLERSSLSFGLGLGALSVSLLALGMAGLYRGAGFAALCSLFSLLALFAARDSRSRRKEKGGGRAVLDAQERLLVIITAAGAAAVWLTALSPPLFYDALEYHLGVPNLFLLRGGIEHLPRMVLSNYPFGTEMLFLLASRIGGLRLAGLVNFSMGVLCALALTAFAERHWGRKIALMSAALFYLSPMMILTSRYATSEGALSFFFVLVALSLFRWREEGDLRWTFLAGIFGGLAYGTKLVGGLFAVLLPALLIAVAVHRLPRRRVQPVALFLAGAFLASLPWLLKNALFTGNPVYPALAGLFPTPDWGPEQAKMLTASAHASWLTSRSWKDYLLLPWYLAVGGIDLGAASKTLWFWPLVIVCGAVTAAREKEWKARALTVLIFGYFILWAATFWMARFLLPAAGPAAVVVALVFARHLPKAIRGWPATAAVAGLVLWNGSVLLQDAPTRRSFPPAVGMQSRDAYLRGSLRSWPAVKFINENLPAEARILVLGETRVAYLRRDHLFQTVFDRPLLDDIIGGLSAPDEITAAMGREGLTHVLVNMRELVRLERERRSLPFGDRSVEVFVDYLRENARLLLAGNGVFLFEVPPSGETAPSRTFTGQMPCIRRAGAGSALHAGMSERRGAAPGLDSPTHVDYIWNTCRNAAFRDRRQVARPETARGACAGGSFHDSEIGVTQGRPLCRDGSSRADHDCPVPPLRRRRVHMG